MLLFSSALLAQTNIYWTDYTTDIIQKSDLDGNNTSTVTTAAASRGLFIDELNGYIYYTDNDDDKIIRKDLDGNNPVDLVSTGSSTFLYLVVDVAGGKMYWSDTESGKDHISRANLDGTGQEVIYTAASDNINGIALDFVNNKLYWTQQVANNIRKSDFDGTNVENVITGLNNPYGIALDVNNNYMYWTDFGDDKVYRATLSGASKTELATTGTSPKSIAIDFTNSKLYWTDSGPDEIQSCDISGGSTTVIKTGLTNPSAIALYGVGPTTTFTGTGNWSTSARWTYGIPGGTAADAVISGTCTIDDDYTIDDLTVSSDYSLTISSTTSLTVNGTLSVADSKNNRAAGTLTVESDATGTGSLIESSGVTATVKRYITEDIYHYLSSPVSNQAISVLQSGTPQTDFDLFWYDEDLSGGTGPSWIDASSQGGNMEVGLGYAYAYNPSNRTISFSGTTNTGTHTETVTYTYDAALSTDEYYFGWNLVGNPYPSRVDATAFIDDADNSNIDGTLQFWDEGAGFSDDRNDYATWNKTGAVAGGGGNTPNGYIDVGQGFMVHYGSGTSQTTSTLRFKDNMRVTNSAQFFKSQETVKRFKISLEGETTAYSETLIGFLDGTTNGFDNKYDGIRRSGNIYTKLVDDDGNYYVIQGLPPYTEDIDIKLCYKASVEGSYTIKVVDIENFENSEGIYLKDLEKNIITDLTKEQEYIFNITETGHNEDRFLVKFTKGPIGIGENDDNIEDMFHIYSSNDKLVVKNMHNEGAFDLYIYNISGQLVSSQKLTNNCSCEIPMYGSPGIYIVKVVGENQVYSTKINYR